MDSICENVRLKHPFFYIDLYIVSILLQYGYYVASISGNKFGCYIVVNSWNVILSESELLFQNWMICLHPRNLSELLN